MSDTPESRRSPSLKDRLDAARSDSEASADPAVLAEERRVLLDFGRSGIFDHAVKAGDQAPPFRLPDDGGAPVTSRDLLRDGPLVISFFRGDWCAYCRLEMQALAAVQPEIRRLGATLVGISPYASGARHGAGRSGGPQFPTLVDTDCATASLYRIAFRIPETLRAAYLKLGLPEPAADSPGRWLLPTPATYVVNRTGRIVLSYLDSDYTTRLEPSEIVTTLARLGRRSARRPSARSDRKKGGRP